METYLLKASAILAIFLLIYQLLLKNETFFRLNRFFLLSGLLAATLLPFVSIQKEVIVPVKYQTGNIAATAIATTSSSDWFTWEGLLWGAYLAGAGVFLLIMGQQLWKLLKLIRKGNTVREDGFILIPSGFTKAPFSFFRYIFYNPQSHKPDELQLILEHEKAHGRQLHSIDILFGRIVAVLLWINPLAWWYQKSIQQNLEYLADAQAVRQVPSVRDYQYTLLKVSGNSLTPALVNAFYSSLIKKRIVMLHQNQSKSTHLLKYLLILPVLALFLMAFNRETVYVAQDPSTQVVFTGQQKVFEAIINKNTSDEELLNMKEMLKKDQVDFSYTVVRNKAGEIIDISFDFKGKAENGNPFSGSYASDSDTPIKPIMIRINSTGGIYFGEAEAQGANDFYFDTKSGNSTVMIQKSGDQDEEIIEIRKVNGKEVFIINEKEVTQEEFEKAYLRNLEAKEKNMIKMVQGADNLSGKNTVWVQKSGGSESEEVIEIRKEDGKEVIILNGEEITEEELHKMGGSKKITVKVLGDGDDAGSEEEVQEIRIIGADSGDEIIEINTTGDKTTKYKTVIIDKEKSGEHDNLHVITTDGKEPLYFIDGKKASKKKMDNLNPDQIESINVIKGDAAVKKYGDKAKDGVVEIITKKE